MKHDRHSSPCVVSASPSCVYLKDGTKVVIRYPGNFDTPKLEVVPQSVIKAQEPLGKKVMCALEMTDRTVIKRLREAMKKYKPPKYPEVDRFIKKKREMEKEQKKMKLDTELD